MGFLILPLLKSISWIYYLAPARIRRLWACAFGRLLRALNLRAKVIRENLAIAFPGPENAAKREELFRESYRHLGQLFLEISMVLGPMKRFAWKEVEVVGGENLTGAMKSGGGAIVLASHIGNWEVLAAGGGMQLGLNPLLVTKLLKPSWLHAAIERGRARCDVKATYEPRTFRDVLAELKRGGMVGIILDQYAGPPVGVRVPVFGVPVGTHTVVAMLAKRTGAPVVPSLNYRTPSGGYRIEFFPPLGWLPHDDPNHELALNTARYSALLEKHILEQPGQWLWSHRRFKGDLGPLREGEWSEGRARR